MSIVVKVKKLTVNINLRDVWILSTLCLCYALETGHCCVYLYTVLIIPSILLYRETINACTRVRFDLGV